MLKLEKSMIERILNGKASIEFQIEAYKAIGENLSRLEDAIKECKASKVDLERLAKVVAKTEVKSETKETEEIKITNKETVEPEVKETVIEAKLEVKKELDPDKATQEIKQEAKRQIEHNKMVKCGPNEGCDEVVYIEKKGDEDIHTWQGQIRLDNVVYNFHWSNELSLPVVYNVPDVAYLLVANDIIRSRVGEAECNKYDLLFTNVPELGNYEGRYYYDEIEAGAFIYMTPWFKVNADEPKVWFKGYVKDHAFVVFSDKRIYYRNVNYLFAKRPWETTVSKGYNTKEIRAEVCKLMRLSIDKFNKFVNGEIKPEPKIENKIENKVENKVENKKGNDAKTVSKDKKITAADAANGVKYEDTTEQDREMLDSLDLEGMF